MKAIPYADPRLEPFRAVLRAMNKLQEDITRLCRLDAGRAFRADPTDPLSPVLTEFTQRLNEMRAVFLLLVPTDVCEFCNGEGCKVCEWIGYGFRCVERTKCERSEETI